MLPTGQDGDVQEAVAGVVSPGEETPSQLTSEQFSGRTAEHRFNDRSDGNNLCYL